MIDFGISILSGIVCALIIWLTTKVLAPQYLAWRYNAPKLEGNWSFYDSEDKSETPSGTATIKQTDENIVASTNRSRTRSGKPTSRNFIYKGKVREGQLLLTFNEPVAGGFISGNLVLKVSSDLKTLSGYTVYLNRDSAEVVAHPICYVKN